jgi:Transcriptional regulators
VKENGKRTIVFSVKRLSNNIKRLLDNYPIKSGDIYLTGMQCGFIRYIGEQSLERDVFQKDIEVEFNIRRSTATGILQLMERNDLLKREVVPSDGRLKRIVLTPRGMDTKKEVYKKIVNIEARVRKDLTEEEVETFHKIVNKIMKTIE